MFSERLWCLFELTGSPVLLVMVWCPLVLGDCSVSVSVPGDMCAQDGVEITFYLLKAHIYQQQSLLTLQNTSSRHVAAVQSPCCVLGIFCQVAQLANMGSARLFVTCGLLTMEFMRCYLFAHLSEVLLGFSVIMVSPKQS